MPDDRKTRRLQRYAILDYDVLDDLVSAEEDADGAWCDHYDVTRLEDENAVMREALQEIASGGCDTPCQRRQERGRPCSCDSGVARAALAKVEGRDA